MSKELKPCPFCGGTNIQKIDSDTQRDENGHIVIIFEYECADCGCLVDSARWNTRSVENSLRQRIAELEEALREIIPNCMPEDEDDAAAVILKIAEKALEALK